MLAVEKQRGVVGLQDPFGNSGLPLLSNRRFPVIPPTAAPSLAVVVITAAQPFIHGCPLSDRSISRSMLISMSSRSSRYLPGTSWSGVYPMLPNSLRLLTCPKRLALLNQQRAHQHRAQRELSDLPPGPARIFPTRSLRSAYPHRRAHDPSRLAHPRRFPPSREVVQLVELICLSE